MPKKVKFESFKYRFLSTARDAGWLPAVADQPGWEEFVHSLDFRYEKGCVDISWLSGGTGKVSMSLREPIFHLRGDTEEYAKRQREAGFMLGADLAKHRNEAFFSEAVSRVALSAGYKASKVVSISGDDRLAVERDFHDAWAKSEDVDNIDVKRSNEACTAPEMRYIAKRLGDIRGKRLLDIGCGLGEASVYFALLGADVTSSDISEGMLEITSQLAIANGVSVKQHVASAEDMGLLESEEFDIIYAGNLLHHVDIEATIRRVKPHLAKEGVLVTWDPLAYNPAINVYRSIATGVRTPDEHPLTWADIKLFKRHFGSVETRYFWLSTLLIFVIMALGQRRSPNSERFWKVIVQEDEKWAWLYNPLKKVDDFLLAIFPPLRLLCWNVVIVCKH